MNLLEKIEAALDCATPPMSDLLRECEAYVRAALAERESKMKSILLIVSDDSFACSFQSMGQYRSALIKAIRGES